jgi:hypothetical protein
MLGLSVRGWLTCGGWLQTLALSPTTSNVLILYGSELRISENSVKPYVAPTAVPADSNAATVERDGQHDFDFIFGEWQYQLKRRLNPLTGSTKWAEYEGTGHGIKIWNGRANLDEFEGDGAK